MSFQRWDEYYQGEHSWPEFLGSLSDYSPFLECIIAEKPGRAIEVGCGPASKSIFLSYLGYDCTAVDNDSAVLALAERNNVKFGGKVQFKSQNAFSMEFSDDSFDVAHHSGFLEHFSDEDIVRLIREQLRIARKVVFTVPNEHYPQQDFGNERLMSLSQWENILREFSIDVSEYFYPSYATVIPIAALQVISNRMLGKDIRKQVFYLAKVSKKS